MFGALPSMSWMCRELPSAERPLRDNELFFPQCQRLEWRVIGPFFGQRELNFSAGRRISGRFTEISPQPPRNRPGPRRHSPHPPGRRGPPDPPLIRYTVDPRSAQTFRTLQAVSHLRRAARRAGATTLIVGSPTPPQKSWLGTMTVSTL